MLYVYLCSVARLSLLFSSQRHNEMEINRENRSLFDSHQYPLRAIAVKRSEGLNVGRRASFNTRDTFSRYRQYVNIPPTYRIYRFVKNSLRYPRRVPSQPLLLAGARCPLETRLETTAGRVSGYPVYGNRRMSWVGVCREQREGKIESFVSAVALLLGRIMRSMVATWYFRSTSLRSLLLPWEVEVSLLLRKESFDTNIQSRTRGFSGELFESLSKWFSYMTH